MKHFDHFLRSARNVSRMKRLVAYRKKALKRLTRGLKKLERPVYALADGAHDQFFRNVRGSTGRGHAGMATVFIREEEDEERRWACIGEFDRNLTSSEAETRSIGNSIEFGTPNWPRIEVRNDCRCTVAAAEQAAGYYRHGFMPRRLLRGRSVTIDYFLGLERVAAENGSEVSYEHVGRDLVEPADFLAKKMKIFGRENLDFPPGYYFIPTQYWDPLRRCVAVVPV